MSVVNRLPGTDTVRFGMLLDFRSEPYKRPTSADYERDFELVREAERLGFSSVWCTEQHGVDDGYLPTQMPMLAALARETTTIGLGSGVILLPLTHARRVAEEAAVVDLISGGRLIVGVGAGHHPHEFSAFGVRLADRARVMEEGIPFLRSGLAGELPPDGLPLNVLPAQPKVPVVVGGVVSQAIDRAVRLSDGHFAYSYIDPDEALPRQWRERIRPALEKHDRELDSFRLIFTSVVWPSDDYEAEWREFVYPAFRYQQLRYAEWAGSGELPEGLLHEDEGRESLRRRMLVGTPEEIVDRLNAIRTVYPFDEVVIWPRLPGVPRQLAERCLQTIGERVAPALNSAAGLNEPR